MSDTACVIGMGVGMLTGAWVFWCFYCAFRGNWKYACAQQEQEIERLRREVALLKADDAERCALIRDMEEEERKKDAVIEQQRQEIERLQNTAEELENVILETGETET